MEVEYDDSIVQEQSDIQNCNNYMGIKLLSHTKKVWERVVKLRVRKGVAIFENHFRFILGLSTIEAIHLIMRLVEQYRERKKNLYLMFIDLEKAYNKVLREVMWRCLEDRGVSMAYTKVIKDMYKGAKTRVRIVRGVS